MLIIDYQDAERAGRRLLEGCNDLLLNGEATTVSSYVERFCLSARADHLGISQHVTVYPSERLVLVHSEGGAGEPISELFRKERHVDHPQVGEWINLIGETRRRKVAPLLSPAPKRSATRIKRYKTEVVIVREGNRLVLELPETFDKTLIPEGRYQLEAQMAAIAKLKLIERPGDAPTAEEDVEEETDAQKELV